jgi:hypothetical protein
MASMITPTAAQQIVLDRITRSDVKMCVQSCESSPRGDYWIIRANSEDYVVHGRTERCYVGVSAYLVDSRTGALEIVGSGAGWQQYLQDKYDLEAAGDGRYILAPDFGFDDKRAVINLRQRLDCSLELVRAMVSDRAWLTGKLRVLKCAKGLLEKQGISTAIRIEPGTMSAAPIGEGVWHWDALKKVLQAVTHD